MQTTRSLCRLVSATVRRLATAATAMQTALRPTAAMKVTGMSWRPRPLLQRLVRVVVAAAEGADAAAGSSSPLPQARVEVQAVAGGGAGVVAEEPAMLLTQMRPTGRLPRLPLAASRSLALMRRRRRTTARGRGHRLALAALMR